MSRYGGVVLGCDMHIKWHIVGASEAHNGCLVLASCFLIGGLGVVIGTDGLCRAKLGGEAMAVLSVSQGAGLGQQEELLGR